jgi:hypothetical protein
VSDKAAVGRVVRTWRDLAPAGDDLEERRRTLERIGRRLANEPCPDFQETRSQLTAYQLILLHQEEDLFEGVTRKNRAVQLKFVEDGCGLRPRLKRALLEARRLHREGQVHKWYGHPELRAPRRAWRKARIAYERALKALENDPLFRFLTARPFKAAPRGNPLKARNKALREALRARGLAPREIATILSAIGFTSVIPPQR